MAMDVVMTMFMKQMGVDPRAMMEKVQEFMTHHEQLVQSLNELHKGQIILTQKITRMESVLHELIPHPDGDTFEQMDPENYRVKEITHG